MSTVKTDLDNLIDWYDKNKPNNQPLVIPVKAAEATIKKFARMTGGKWFYRGREITPTKPSKK